MSGPHFRCELFTYSKYSILFECLHSHLPVYLSWAPCGYFGTKYILFLTEHGEEDKILAEGIGHFLEDLNLDPASLKVLIIAWKFRAATQCEFTRKEFTDGMIEIK